MPTIQTGSDQLAAQRLVQQVGADVAGPDDGRVDLHVNSGTRSAPMPSMPAMHHIAGVDRFQRHQRAGQHDLSGPQRRAERAQRVRKPRHALSGEPRAAAPAPVLMTSPFFSTTHPAAARSMDLGSTAWVPSTNEAAGRVVGDGVLDPDLPVPDAGIDDLEAGQNAIGRRQHVGGGDAGAHEIAAHDKGDLAFGPRLDQQAGDGYRFARGSDMASVR